LTLIAVRSQHQHSAAEIVEAFQLFDEEGTGYVHVSKFRAAMKELVRVVCLVCEQACACAVACIDLRVNWWWSGALRGVRFQTHVEDDELEALVLEATDGDPTATAIDYNAFITKVLAV
jgi:Ca2+-binding EF-hand superfamily protein